MQREPSALKPCARRRERSRPFLIDVSIRDAALDGARTSVPAERTLIDAEDLRREVGRLAVFPGTLEIIDE